RQGRIPGWRNGLQWRVLARRGCAVIATLVSTDKRISLLGYYKSYDGLYSAVAFTLLFFAVAEAFRSDDVKRALAVFYFGGGGLTVLYGVIQFHDRMFGG